MEIQISSRCKLIFGVDPLPEILVQAPDGQEFRANYCFAMLQRSVGNIPLTSDEYTALQNRRAEVDLALESLRLHLNPVLQAVGHVDVQSQINNDVQRRVEDRKRRRAEAKAAKYSSYQELKERADLDGHASGLISFETLEMIKVLPIITISAEEFFPFISGLNTPPKYCAFFGDANDDGIQVSLRCFPTLDETRHTFSHEQLIAFYLQQFYRLSTPELIGIVDEDLAAVPPARVEVQTPTAFHEVNRIAHQRAIALLSKTMALRSIFEERGIFDQALREKLTKVKDDAIDYYQHRAVSIRNDGFEVVEDRQANH